jgi:hypothetical protein
VDVAVELATNVTPVGFKDAVPVGETITESETVFAKLWRLVTFTLEVAMAPALTLTVVGVTLTLKSGAAPTMTVIVAICDNVPLTPVTVTEYVPASVLEATATMSVEVAEVRVEESDTLIGLRVAVRPTLFVIALRATRPVKPFSPVTVTKAVVDEPGVTDGGEGVLAVTVKSLITAVIANDWTKVAPLGNVTVPFTVPS